MNNVLTERIITISTNTYLSSQQIVRRQLRKLSATFLFEPRTRLSCKGVEDVVARAGAR
jgi:hypothetical protein